MAEAKFQQLKRRAAQDAIIMGVVATIFVGMYIGISGYITGLEDEKRSLISSAQSMKREAGELEDAYAKARKSIALYEQLTNKGNSKDPLNREGVAQILGDLKQRYRLGTLELAISPLQRLTNKDYRVGNVGVVFSTVTLKFSGLTDEALLSFVDAVEDEFSGYVRIDSLSIERKQEVNEEIIQQVSLGKTPELVEGKMAFHWFGLEDLSQNREGGS